MSFSSEVKEELSKFNSFNNENLVYAELYGYMLSSNIKYTKTQIIYTTTSEYNINRFGKMLARFKIEYKIKIVGNNFRISFSKDKLNLDLIQINTNDEKRAVIRGSFMGGGLINNPNDKYHLEIKFKSDDGKNYVQNLINEFEIQTKSLERKESYSLYIKDGEMISNLLAIMGANSAVLRYEEIRVLKDKRNSINRIVNCETANLNKTIGAAVAQVQAIEFIKSVNKFEELPEALREIAELRLENPEMSLLELGKLLSTPLGKSGVNHRMSKIIDYAKQLKEEKV